MSNSRNKIIEISAKKSFSEARFIVDDLDLDSSILVPIEKEIVELCWSVNVP